MFSVIQEWSDKPFRYGLDCCQFVGAVIEFNTGVNPADRFSYSTEKEAQAIIDSFGSLENLVRDVFGDPIPVSDAVDGDALLIDVQDGGQMVGIVYKSRCVVRTKSGLTDWPLEFARLAWRN